MIEYFKFTGGDAFTLSGEDYNGFFNVKDGVPYSGRTFTSDSHALSSKDTFLSVAFLQKKEFDRTAAPLDTSNTLTVPEISPRNIIDQSFIDKNLGILNQNNINLYSLNIVSNTNLLDFANSAKDGNAYFLGLSSGKNDLRNDDVSLPKDNIIPIQIDPFSFINKLQDINTLDNTIDSEIFVYDDDSYFYFTTTPTNSFTFSGSFVKNTQMVRVDSGLFPKNLKFTYDNSTDTLYSLVTSTELETTQTILKLYDNSFVNPCGNLKLKDEISLGDDPILDESVEIGKNLLGYRFLSDSGEVMIQLNNKFSHAPVGTISTSTFGDPGLDAETIVAFDIRDTDDSILILTTPPPSQGVVEGDPGGTNPAPPFYMYQLDAEQLTDVGPSVPREVIGRWLPDYDYIAKDEIDVFFSGTDSNIFTLYDNGFVTTRFISNPSYIAGFPSYDNLLYLPTMYFNDTHEHFDTIEKKFNSNILRSNYYNNLNFLVTKNSSNVFYFLHNIGRIYLFRESNLLYKNYVPLSLPNLYDKITSCESSLGISMNSELQNIIKDAVNIFLNLSLIPVETISDGIPILRGTKGYEGIEVDFRNLEFHDNEEVNYTVISRVFNEIFELQKSILNVIIDEEGAGVETEVANQEDLY